MEIIDLAGLARFTLTPVSTMRDAMACINANAGGVALIVDEEERLQGLITDGDIRRALLAGCGIDDRVDRALAIKANQVRKGHVSVPSNATRHDILATLNSHGVAHLPIVDEESRVVALAIRSAAVIDEMLPVTAVVMAGGFGRRLGPLTAEVPKPMLPIGAQPILELIIEQLRRHGVRDVVITTHYRAGQIVSHFGDGHGFDVNIDYIHEETPLGTAGALRLLDKRRHDTLLVVNGDVLCRTDYRSMLSFHQEQDAELSVGLAHYEFVVPFGIVDTEGTRITGLREKPGLTFLVNAGIYMLKSSILDLIPPDQPFDMTDLIGVAMATGRLVAGYPIHEGWLDIGRHEDYGRAMNWLSEDGPGHFRKKASNV